MNRPTRILIAEDDALVRDMVRARLNGAGYDTYTGRTGSEAIERVIQLRPHALLLDINLPDLDGFGVLEVLQTDLSDVSLPTIMLTARRSSEDVRRAIALGAADYLTKDVIAQQLLARLARSLRMVSRQVQDRAAA